MNLEQIKTLLATYKTYKMMANAMRSEYYAKKAIEIYNQLEVFNSSPFIQKQINNLQNAKNEVNRINAEQTLILAA